MKKKALPRHLVNLAIAMAVVSSTSFLGMTFSQSQESFLSAAIQSSEDEAIGNTRYKFSGIGFSPQTSHTETISGSSSFTVLDGDPTNAQLDSVMNELLKKITNEEVSFNTTTLCAKLPSSGMVVSRAVDAIEPVGAGMYEMNVMYEYTSVCSKWSSMYPQIFQKYGVLAEELRPEFFSDITAELRLSGDYLLSTITFSSLDAGAEVLIAPE
jgi:hypothetical protein